MNFVCGCVWFDTFSQNHWEKTQPLMRDSSVVIEVLLYLGFYHWKKMVGKGRNGKLGASCLDAAFTALTWPLLQSLFALMRTVGTDSVWIWQDERFVLYIFCENIMYLAFLWILWWFCFHCSSRYCDPSFLVYQKSTEKLNLIHRWIKKLQWGTVNWQVTMSVYSRGSVTSS